MKPLNELFPSARRGPPNRLNPPPPSSQKQTLVQRAGAAFGTGVNRFKKNVKKDWKKFKVDTHKKLTDPRTYARLAGSGIKLMTQ